MSSPAIRALVKQAGVGSVVGAVFAAAWMSSVNIATENSIERYYKAIKGAAK